VIGEILAPLSLPLPQIPNPFLLDENLFASLKKCNNFFRKSRRTARSIRNLKKIFPLIKFLKTLHLKRGKEHKNAKE